MQQLEMVNHMESTLKSMPSCVQTALQKILRWLNTTFGAESNNVRRKTTKQPERKRNNCQITGATTCTDSGLLQQKTNSSSESDGSVHIRLPDQLIRRISDRYRRLE